MANEPASKRASLLRRLESTRGEWLARYAATGELPSLDGVELVPKVSTSGVGNGPVGSPFDRLWLLSSSSFSSQSVFSFPFTSSVFSFSSASLHLLSLSCYCGVLCWEYAHSL